MTTVKAIDKAEVMAIPQEMLDPSYVDALAEEVQKGIHNLGLVGAREIVLVCIARGLWQPSGWEHKQR